MRGWILGGWLLLSACETDGPGGGSLTPNLCGNGVACTPDSGVAPPPKAYPVQLTASEGGRIEDGAGAVLCASGPCTVASTAGSMTIVAVAAPGYRFTGWTGTGVCSEATTASLTLDTVSAPTCTASFVRRITISSTASGASGTVVVASTSNAANCAGASCEVDLGAAVTLTAPTVAGYRFTGWSGAGCPTDKTPTVTFMPIANASCLATYVTGIAILGSVSGATGSVVATSSSPGAVCEGSGCSLDAGGSVTLTAPMIATARFSGWTGDPACTGTQRTLVVGPVSQSASCVANYVPLVTVTGAIVGATGGTVTATSTAPSASCTGSVCTVSAGNLVRLAAPDLYTAYRFDHWSGTLTGCSGTNPTIDVTAGSANATCTANYITWGCNKFCAGICEAPVCLTYSNLAVDANYAWFIRQGYNLTFQYVPTAQRVMRVPVGGGTISEWITSPTASLNAIAEDANNVYTLGYALTAYSKATGAATTVYANGQGFRLLRIGTNLFWLSYGSQIIRGDVGGGTPVAIATRVAAANLDSAWMAADATYIYYEDDEKVKRVPQNSDGSVLPTTIAAVDSAGTFFGGAAVAEGRLFFPVERADFQAYIADVNLAAVNDVVYLPTAGRAVASDGTRAFWSTNLARGLAYSATRGSQSTLALPVYPADFKIDGTFVYTLSGDGYTRVAR